MDHCSIFILAMSSVSVGFWGEVSFVFVFTFSLPDVVFAVSALWQEHDDNNVLVSSDTAEDQLPTVFTLLSSCDIQAEVHLWYRL